MGLHAKTAISWYLDELDDVGMSRHTLRAYRYALERYAATLARRGRGLASARHRDVVAHRRELAQTLSPASVRVHLSAIRQLHAYLVAIGELDRDVASVVRSPRRTDDEHVTTCMRVDEVEQLRDALHGCPLDELLMCLLYNCALRVSEAVELRRERIHLASGVLVIVGKGRRRRDLVMDAPSRYALEDWVRTGQASDEYLLPARTASSRTPHLRAQTVSRRLRAGAARAGLNPLVVHPHALRHARAEHLRASGMDVAQVAAILGHASVSMTAHYMHPPTSLDGVA